VAAYDSDKLAGSLARALTPQNTLQRTRSGTPATESDFYRIHEEACTLLLLQPQLAYWFAHRATNQTRAYLRQTVATLETIIISLVDSLTPAVPVSSTESLTAALQHLQTADRVASATGGSTRTVEHSMSRALDEIDAFSRELLPNVAPRVGGRTVDTAYAIGNEAMETAREAMETADKQYLRLNEMLSALRSSVPQLSVESMRQKVSPSLMQRAEGAVASAISYYDRTAPEEATKVSSAVLANLQAFSTGTRLVDAARSPLVPKVLSKQLQLDDARARPSGSDLRLVPAGDPEPLTVELTPADVLPVGTTLSYARDGGPDVSVAIPGSGLWSMLGNTDLSSVVIPNPSYLYVEQGGTLTPIPLTPGTQNINQVVSDINAVIPGFASQFGNTGRLSLVSTAEFSLASTFTFDAVPSVTSDTIPLPSGTDWQNTELMVVVSDSAGVHYQSHTFPAPFTPADIAAVVAELSVASFTDDGGTPVLSVSNSGDALVLSSVESGGVTITVNLFSTVITGGHLPWTHGAAYGRGSQGDAAGTVLGLLTPESTERTNPQDIADAVNDADSALNASLTETGTVLVQAVSPTLSSSLEVKASTGSTELGATPGLTRASTTHMEIRGVAADGASSETHDPELLGVQEGDRVRIASGSEEFDVSVASVSDGEIVVATGVPGDLGESNTRIDDGAQQQFVDMSQSLRRVPVSQMGVRGPRELRDFHQQWLARLTGRQASPGDVKKAVTVYVGILDALTDTPAHPSELQERLALLNLALSPVSPTVEASLVVNDAPTWAPGTEDAAKAMLQSFEERGYDRAVDFLSEGRLLDFVELTPLQASRSGRVEDALYSSVEAMRGRT